MHVSLGYILAWSILILVFLVSRGELAENKLRNLLWKEDLVMDAELEKMCRFHSDLADNLLKLNAGRCFER